MLKQKARADSVKSCERKLPSNPVRRVPSWHPVQMRRSPGITFSSDVDYSQTRNGVTCSAKFTAVGLWPPVHCGSDVDCDPCADPLNGRPTGSGINPDLRTKCDVDLGLCVLAGNTMAESDLFYSPEELRTRSEECAARTASAAQ